MYQLILFLHGKWKTLLIIGDDWWGKWGIYPCCQNTTNQKAGKALHILQYLTNRINEHKENWRGGILSAWSYPVWLTVVLTLADVCLYHWLLVPDCSYSRCQLGVAMSSLSTLFHFTSSFCFSWDVSHSRFMLVSTVYKQAQKCATQIKQCDFSLTKSRPHLYKQMQKCLCTVIAVSFHQQIM